MAVSPYQLTVVQCLRKFAYTYGFDPALPQEWDTSGGPAANFGRAVHTWLEVYAKTGVAADPESRIARCGSQAIPLIVPGAKHEVRVEALYKGAKMAARVDMLAADGRTAWDWKTGQRKTLEELREDIQWNVTAYVLGTKYGWPVELRWAYLDKEGKKLPHVVADVVADNSTWMAALDESIHDVEIMWELQGSVLPSETPPNPLACDMRGKFCDFSGHCDFKGIPGIMTADELKAAYAKRLQGNAAINPKEIPAVPAASPEELEAKQGLHVAEVPMQPANNLPLQASKAVAVMEREVPAKKRGRPVGSKNAPKEPALPAADITPDISLAAVSEDLGQQIAQLQARNNKLEEDKAALMGGVPAAVRSTWTLGDLGRLSDELVSHGISVSFSFRERT